METIGEKIKQIRMSKGIRQIDMAESGGISLLTYGNFERGKLQTISIDAGKGIAKALNVPFVELFEIEYNPEPDNRVDELMSEIKELKSRLKDKELIIQLLTKQHQS